MSAVEFVATCADGSAHLTPRDLPARWRSRAEDLRPYAEAAARAFEHAADELEHVLHGEADELLTLSLAAELSGYTEDHLGRLIKQGSIPNAGRARAPRIRRADLPRRPTRIASTTVRTYDPDADARSLASRRKELAT